MPSDLTTYDGYDAMMLGDIPTTKSRVVQAEMPGLFGSMDDEKAVFDSINANRAVTPRTLADDAAPVAPVAASKRPLVIGAVVALGLVLGLSWLARRK